MTRFKPLMFAVMVGLPVLMTGCADHGRDTQMDRPPVTKIQFFDQSSGGREIAALVYQGTGESVGPDFRPRPVQVFRLEEEVFARSGSWLLAVEPGSANIVAAYRECAVFSLKSGECRPSEEVQFALHDWPLFFGSTFLLTDTGQALDEARIQLLSAPGEEAVVAKRDSTNEYGSYKVGRRVEYGYLEASNSTGGSLLECNLLEGDEIRLAGNRVGCLETSSSLSWWIEKDVVAQFIPTSAPQWETPFATRPDPNGIPSGTEGYPFPLPEAIRVIKEKAPGAGEFLARSDWRMSSFEQLPTESSQFGGIATCQRDAWRVTVAVPAQDGRRYMASREVCEGIVTNESASAEGTERTLYPRAHDWASLSEVEAQIARAFCAPREHLPPYMFSMTRHYGATNATWVVIGGFLAENGPSGQATRSTTTVDPRGHALRILNAESVGPLGGLFRGTSDC